MINPMCFRELCSTVFTIFCVVAISCGLVGFRQESKSNRDEWATLHTDNGITDNPNSYCYKLLVTPYAKL